MIMQRWPLARPEYIEAAWKMDDQLEKINQCPLLFVEYAVGLEPAAFAAFFAVDS